MGVLEGLRKSVGLGALVLALASGAYAAGPAKQKAASNLIPTPTAIYTQEPSTLKALIGQHNLSNVSKLYIHAPLDPITHKPNQDKAWFVFVDKKNKNIGVYDVESAQMMKEKLVTATPVLTPTAPILSLDLEQITVETAASTPAQTYSPTSTQTSTVGSQMATPTATPKPKPSLFSRIQVPLIVGGKASGGYSNEKLGGKTEFGSWNEAHSGPLFVIRDATVKTDHNYGKALFHGGLLVDGSYLSGSINGIEAGRFKDLEAFARLFAGAGYKLSDSLTPIGAIGAGYAIKSDKFQYDGGTFSKSSHTSLRPPGLEFRLMALTPYVNLGLKDRYLVYSASQDGYNSRNTENQLAFFAEMPKIDTPKGHLNANLEAGLRSTNSIGLSNQGDWKQSIAYLFVEVGKDFDGIPIFAYFGFDTLFRQPDVGFSLDSTRYLAGLGLNPFYRLGGAKK